jgi:hypothetical protein
MPGEDAYFTALRKEGGNKRPFLFFTEVPKLGWWFMGCYNPSKQEVGQENHEFKASLGYTARLCLKIITKTKVPDVTAERAFKQL